MKKVIITTITGIDIELTANDDSAVTFLTQFADHNSRAGIRATNEHGILANHWFNFENIVSIYTYDAE